MLLSIVCMLFSGTHVVIVTVFDYGPNPLADPYAMPLHQQTINICKRYNKAGTVYLLMFSSYYG